MNVKRFTARTSREALRLVRQALGDDAVVLSTKPSAGGVEVLAMAPEGMRQVEDMAARSRDAGAAARRRARRRARPDQRRAGRRAAVDEHAVVPGLCARAHAQAPPGVALNAAPPTPSRSRARRCRGDRAVADVAHAIDEARRQPSCAPRRRAASSSAAAAGRPRRAGPRRRGDDALARRLARCAPVARRRRRRRRRDQRAGAQEAMMSELRSMKGLIEERFGALAFMEKLQRQPAQARLTQKLLDCGFSPALIRKLAEGLRDRRRRRSRVGGRRARTQPAHRRSRGPARRPGRRLRAGRRHRRRQDHDDREDRRRLRGPVRRRQPRPDHARRLPRRRPRAAARLRPHPRRAGAHRARPRLARRPARSADRQEDGADRHRRHGAARHAHPRAARDADAPLDPASCSSSTPRRRARRSRTC